MKKIFSLIVMAAVLVLAASCNKNTQRLHDAVEKMNSECPMTLGGVVVLEKVDYAEYDNTVEYHVSVPDQIVDLMNDNAALMNEMDAAKEFVNPEERDFFEAVTEAGANILVIYKGADSGKKFELEISGEYIKKAFENE